MFEIEQMKNIPPIPTCIYLLNNAKKRLNLPKTQNSKYLYLNGKRMERIDYLAIGISRRISFLFAICMLYYAQGYLKPNVCVR